MHHFLDQYEVNPNKIFTSYVFFRARLFVLRTDLFTNTAVTLILFPGHPIKLDLFCCSDNGALLQQKNRRILVSIMKCPGGKVSMPAVSVKRFYLTFVRSSIQLCFLNQLQQDDCCVSLLFQKNEMCCPTVKCIMSILIGDLFLDTYAAYFYVCFL